MFSNRKWITLQILNNNNNCTSHSNLKHLTNITKVFSIRISCHGMATNIGPRGSSKILITIVNQVNETTFQNLAFKPNIFWCIVVKIISPWLLKFLCHGSCCLYCFICLVKTWPFPGTWGWLKTLLGFCAHFQFLIEYI